jgi:hypothetical protein
MSKIVRFPQAVAQSHTSGFVVRPFARVCKISMGVGTGGLVRWSTGGSNFDYIECGVRSLHQLRLELKDADGNLLDLQNSAFSMTLFFFED